jgi:hypothetical protein
MGALLLPLPLLEQDNTTVKAAMITVNTSMTPVLYDTIFPIANSSSLTGFITVLPHSS